MIVFNKFVQLIVISHNSASWELLVHQYSCQMCGPMNNPKVDTRYQESNSGPYNSEINALPHHHKLKPFAGDNLTHSHTMTPFRQILDSSKLEESADDNFKFDDNGRKLSKRVENTVGKGEIARYKQFLLFPQCFQKVCFPWASKGVIVWE